MSYNTGMMGGYGYPHAAPLAHIDESSDESEDDVPMQNIDVPYTGYALPEPTVSAMSPEDIKPDIASPPNNTSPPSQPAMRLPWMQDESFSAAPSPQQAYTPQDIKTESEAFDDDMNVDEEDDEDAEGEMDDGFEPDEAVELTFEERMRLRFPTFEKEKPLKFTDLTALNPIREVKRRKLEDHPISSIEAEHPLHSQEASFLQPMSAVESLNEPRIHSWTAPMVRRDRKRSSLPLGGRGRLHELITKFEVQDAVAQPEIPLEDKRREKDMAMVELINWEDQIVWGVDDPIKKNVDDGFAKMPKERDGVQKLNIQLKQGDWLSQMVLGVPLPGHEGEEIDSTADPLDVMQEIDAAEKSRTAKALDIIRAPRTDANGLALDFYNWSNDIYYPPQKAQKVTIRQTGLIDIIHAGPAVKLQVPFYKPNLSAEEKRTRNRPRLQFPTGIPIHFDKLLPSTNRTKQQREAIKAMERQGKKVEPEIPQSSKDLSMANRVPYVLLEYSEETPLALSGYGMGSSMINYYKKTFDDDRDYPQFKMGQPVILQPNDPQPYPLAFIDPGQSTRSLQTTFSNAPIFEHQPSPSDFLVIRRTVDGQSRYYIREINNIFVVGQTLPGVSQAKQYMMDMPTSQAATRRGTRWLRMIIKKLLIKHNGLIKQSHLRPFWPEWSDRDWTLFLKTFMFSETKKHDKFWRPMIDDKGVNKTDLELDKIDMTPEELTLHAAMGHVEQFLFDHGHPLPANAKEEKVLIKEMNDSRDLNGDERDQYIETRLAPWYRSQNYAAAAQTSLASGTGTNAISNVLQLKDEGDPTGRGEGFSLLECSRKQLPEMFKRTMQKSKKRGEEENKQTGKLNRDEILRAYTIQQQKIWEAQRRSLTSSIPPKPDRPDDKRLLQKLKIERSEVERQQRIRARYEEEQAGFQIGSDRKLRITWQKKDGSYEQEDITDPVVITAYLQAKLTASIKKDGFSEGGLYMGLNRYEGKVANLKNFKIKLLEENKHELERPKANKPDASAKRTIKCKQCGNTGHNSMSDICPMNQNNPEFLAKKEASKASKRGKRQVEPKTKEFKGDDLRLGNGGGVTSNASAAPMGATAGFKVKLSLNASGGGSGQ